MDAGSVKNHETIFLNFPTVLFLELLLLTCWNARPQSHPWLHPTSRSMQGPPSLGIIDIYEALMIFLECLSTLLLI